MDSLYFIVPGVLLGLVGLSVAAWFFNLPGPEEPPSHTASAPRASGAHTPAHHDHHDDHSSSFPWVRTIGWSALVLLVGVTVYALWSADWSNFTLDEIRQRTAELTTPSPSTPTTPAPAAGSPSGGAPAPSLAPQTPPAQATMPPTTVTASPYTAECPGKEEFYDVGAIMVPINPNWRKCASIITFKGRCIYVTVRDNPVAESQMYCHTIDPATGAEKIPTLPDDVSKISIDGGMAKLKVQLVPRCSTGGMVASIVLPPCKKP